MAHEMPPQNLLQSERAFRVLVEWVVDYATYMLDPEGKIANRNAGASRDKRLSDDRGRRLGTTISPHLSFGRPHRKPMMSGPYRHARYSNERLIRVKGRLTGFTSTPSSGWDFRTSSPLQS